MANVQDAAGLGGTRQLVAGKCNFKSLGIDLRPECIANGEKLADALGLSGIAHFHQVCKNDHTILILVAQLSSGKFCNGLEVCCDTYLAVHDCAGRYAFNPSDST